jgi:MYXO-CTERM domain-containing protein
MWNVRSLVSGALAAALVAGAAQSARAVTILNTGLHESFFGYVGMDIYPDQSVGIAFQPAFDCTLDKVGVWFFSNDFDAPGRTYTLKLTTDAGAGPSIPNTSNVLESWSMATGAVGWTPVLDQAASVTHPLLHANTWYWILAEGNEPAGFDPCWVQSNTEDQYYSAINNAFNPNGWEGSYTFGSTPGTVIDVTPVPEPAALGMLALVGIGSLRRRRA